MRGLHPNGFDPHPATFDVRLGVGQTATGRSHRIFTVTAAPRCGGMEKSYVGMKVIKAGVLDDQEDIEKHGPNVALYGERGAEGWNGGMRRTQGGATRGGLLVFSAFS